MSFSLSNVKYNKGTQNINSSIRSCFTLVKQMDILTNNVKYGINKYINYRFTKRNCKYFKADILQEMIYDLLQYVCGKPYISISLKDVINNEGDILYEIKKAIIYGATKHLYFVPSQEDETNDLTDFYSTFKKQPKDIEKLTEEQLQNEEQVKFYFEDLVI